MRTGRGPGGRFGDGRCGRLDGGWRNEANFGLGRDFGDRRGTGGFGLQVFELLEGISIIALGGIDAALEATEVAGVMFEGSTEVVLVGVEGALGSFDGSFPHMGFGAAKAAEHPVGVDEDVDVEALVGSGGVEASVVVGGEGFEVGGGFSGDDFGFGIDAGFEGVLRRGELAGHGAGSGGFLRIAGKLSLKILVVNEKVLLRVSGIAVSVRATRIDTGRW